MTFFMLPPAHRERKRIFQMSIMIGTPLALRWRLWVGQGNIRPSEGALAAWGLLTPQWGKQEAATGTIHTQGQVHLSPFWSPGPGCPPRGQEAAFRDPMGTPGAGSQGSHPATGPGFRLPPRNFFGAHVPADVDTAVRGASPRQLDVADLSPSLHLCVAKVPSLWVYECTFKIPFVGGVAFGAAVMLCAFRMWEHGVQILAPLLPIQLPLNVHPGRRQVMAQVVGFLPCT